MTPQTPSRRTIVKGAAWSAPVVTIAAAAPSLAASPTCEATYQNVEKTFTYKDILGNDVTVKVTAENVPLTAPAGAALMPISTSSTVTISAASAGLLTGLLLGNATQVDGTSNSTSELSGAITSSSTTALEIARVQVVANQPLVLNATGDSAASAVPDGTSPGLVTITMGSPSSDLVGYNSSGGQTGTTTTTLTKIAGNDYTLATFNVIEC